MKLIYTTTAWMLFIGAVAGIAFSAYGLFTVWDAQNRLLVQLQSGITLIDQTLTTTQEGLAVVDETLTQAQSDLLLIETFTYEVSDAVGNTRPTLEQVSGLFEEDLVDIVSETQSSLRSVKSSAVLMDDTLRLISSIPLIGARYAPAEPLGESIEQLSGALDDLPQSLADIGNGLQTTSEDLSGITDTIDELGQRIGQIDADLEEANLVIIDYQTTTGSLQENLRILNNAIGVWLPRITVGISIFLIWTCIASLGLFSLGVLLLKQAKG